MRNNYSSVDELRQDFSDVQRRLDKESGSTIKDPNLANDLRSLGSGISRFLGDSKHVNDRSEAGTSHQPQQHR